MSNGNALLLAFTAGAAVGAAACWRFAKEKYERQASEEIRESLRRNRVTDPTDDIPSIPEKEETPSGREQAEKYTDILKQTGYNVDPAPINPNIVEKPYVISPDEFGEFEDYQRISLTCYADDVVTDTDGNVIDDVDDIIGNDSLRHFGEYEDDSVFVRNDMRRCDFEILKVEQSYSDFR